MAQSPSQWLDSRLAQDWRPGGPGFESCCGNFASELQNGKSPTLLVYFGGNTKRCRSLPLVSGGLYGRESKIPHTGGRCVACHWCRPAQRPTSRRGQLVQWPWKASRSSLSARDDAADMLHSTTIAGERLRSGNRLPWALKLHSQRLLDPNARQRGVDTNAKSYGNARRIQLPATTPHHREIISRGGHQAFIQPPDG